ncbi:MAG TPA: ribbon-helix-helix protein, CopG family [Pilimelia sp.]|nr:ribbon-helix-helix protein, CopG family [Pilimelia sp.]
MGAEQVSDLRLLDMSPDEVNDMIDNLTSEPVSTPEEEAALLATLPPPPEPNAPMTVVTSLRLPLDLKQRIDAAAEAEGMSASTFIRRAVESVLAGRDKTNLVNLDDVIRAIRSVPHAA